MQSGLMKEASELTGEGIEEGQDFFFISRNSNESTQEAVLEMVTDRIPKRFDLNPRGDIQVLSPCTRKSWGGNHEYPAAESPQSRRSVF